MTKQRLIVVGPVPPPFHGVTVSTSLVVASATLREYFEVEHLDTSDRRALTTLGRWDATNVALGLRATVRLLGLLRGRPGIVYLPISQGPGAFLRDSLFIHCSKLRGWKVAIHLRGSEFRDFAEARSRIFRWWIRGTLGRVDSAAVMGTSLRPVLADFVPSERLAVVPNGTPPVSGDTGGRDMEQILFFSNLRRRKGVEEAVDAAREVVRRHPTARFVFVGSWESDELERSLRARAADAGARIRFLPPASGAAKSALFLGSGMLLFPPVKPEGHPRVVLEGLAAALPVITTNRGAIAETVVDGESGYVLDEPVPELIAEKILLLLNDPGLHARMQAAARARYLAEYTLERSDRRLAEWLAGVAAFASAAQQTMRSVASDEDAAHG